MVSKILIVDDDKNVREVCRWLLQEEGFETEEASTGKEGWELFCKFRFDLILADYDLPVMSGKELKERISKKNPLCPVILMTCEKISDNLYISKPFGPDELIPLIKRTLSC